MAKLQLTPDEYLAFQEVDKSNRYHKGSDKKKVISKVAKHLRDNKKEILVA